MKWPFRLRRKPVIEHTADMDPAGLDEAREARKKSEFDLSTIRGQRAAVEQITDELRDLRAPDQLTKIFEDSIRRKPHHG